jgi:hypothetical protein
MEEPEPLDIDVRLIAQLEAEQNKEIDAEVSDEEDEELYE